MFTMAKVITKNGEGEFGFTTMIMILRTARKNGWKPKEENILIYDRKDSRALSTALEKGLAEIQASQNCAGMACEAPCEWLVVKWTQAELIERFLCFAKGEAFEIQLGEQQEYRGSKPSKVRN